MNNLYNLCIIEISGSYLTNCYSEAMINHKQIELDHIKSNKLETFECYSALEVRELIIKDGLALFEFTERMINLSKNINLIILKPKEDLELSPITPPILINKVVNEVITRFDDAEYIGWQNREECISRAINASVKKLKHYSVEFNEYDIKQALNFSMKDR